jgi:peptidoglycan-associated lipoprotein
MKIKSFGLLVVVVILGFIFSGCVCSQAVKQEAPTPPPAEAPKVAAPEPTKAVVVQQPPAPAPVPEPVPAPPPAAAPAAVLQPVFFDLNKSVITPDAAETLKANLEWFKQNPGKMVKVAGNCDPRASKKYNKALGQRRANATKKYLVCLGVDPKLLQTVSYGKDKPTCKANDESCWAKERRVDFATKP